MTVAGGLLIHVRLMAEHRVLSTTPLQLASVRATLTDCAWLSVQSLTCHQQKVRDHEPLTKDQPCFLLLLFTTVLSQWDFSHGKFRVPSRGKASCNSCATQPRVHAGCFSVFKIQRNLTGTTGSLACTQM